MPIHDLRTEVQKKYKGAIIGVDVGGHSTPNFIPFYISSTGFIKSIDCMGYTNTQYNLQHIFGSLYVYGKILLTQPDKSYVVKDYSTSLASGNLNLTRLDNGYVNISLDSQITAVYILRNGHRQWKRGFSYTAYKLQTNSMIYDHYSIDNISVPTEIYKLMVIYDYYFNKRMFFTIEQSIELLEGMQTEGSIAINKDFSIEKSFMGYLLTHRSCITVGRINDENGKVNLFKPYRPFFPELLNGV